MRIFLDANVLFSAAKSDGAIRALLNILLNSGHECWADDYVISEARRNLQSKGRAALVPFEHLLERLHVAEPGTLAMANEEIQWLPRKDRPVLACAIKLRCEVLVTGDRTHFGAGYGRSFAGVVIHSPRSLAETLDL